MYTETIQVKKERELSSEKEKSPWFVFRWMKRMKSLNRRGVNC